MAGRSLWILEATHSRLRDKAPAHKLGDTEAIWGRERTLKQGQAGGQASLPLRPYALVGPMVVEMSVIDRDTA